MTDITQSPGLGFDEAAGYIVAVERFTGNLYNLDATKGVDSLSGTGAMTLIDMPDDTFVSDVAFRVSEPAGVAILALGLTLSLLKTATRTLNRPHPHLWVTQEAKIKDGDLSAGGSPFSIGIRFALQREFRAWPKSLFRRLGSPIHPIGHKNYFAFD